MDQSTSHYLWYNDCEFQCRPFFSGRTGDTLFAGENKSYVWPTNIHAIRNIQTDKKSTVCQPITMSSGESLESLESKMIEDRTINRLMDKFTNNLDADNILDKCLSKELITGSDLTGINATLKSGRTVQAVRDLMSCVKRSAPGYLKTFCDILSDSKSSFLVPCAEEEYRKQLEEYCKQLEANRKEIRYTTPIRTYEIPAITSHSVAPPPWPDVFTKEITSRYLSSSFEKYRRVSSDLDLVDPFCLPNKTNRSVLENDYPQVLQAVLNMLHAVGDLSEGASLKASVEKCKRLHLNIDNVHSQFTELISAVLDSEPYSWKKVVMFFSTAAGFGINLCTNNMSHLATQLPVWMVQVLQHRLQPWMDNQGGWESFLEYGRDVLSHAKNMKKKKWKSSAVVYGRFHDN